MTEDWNGLPTLVFVVTSLGLGGADQQVRLLASALHDRGWHVAVVSLIAANPVPADLIARGISFETLSMRPGVVDPRALMRFVRLLRRWRPAIVHGHMIHANLLTRIARLFAPTPVVVSTVHNQYEGPRWRYFAYRLTYPLADLTTAVSGAAVEEHVRRRATPRRGIELVPNGVAIGTSFTTAEERRASRDALGIADDAFLWLAAGRLVPAKAYHHMIAALGQVRTERPEARLLIAGEGPERSRIEQLVRDRGLDGSIGLLGPRDDMPTLFRAADGFVLSSDWEGLPMVLLEAAASGLPAVATDVGGNRDTMVNGQTGRLVRPGDPGELATAMVAVMSMPEGRRRAMGDAARVHVATRFGLEQIVDEWQARYRELLERSGGRSRRLRASPWARR